MVEFFRVGSVIMCTFVYAPSNNVIGRSFYSFLSAKAVSGLPVKQMVLETKLQTFSILLFTKVTTVQLKS